MAYSVYNLNNRINNLQSQINAGGGGDASLSANQTFTGINTFNNEINIANTPNATHSVELGNILSTTTIKGSILNNDASIYNIGFNQLGEVNMKGLEINVEGATNINTIGDFDTTIGNITTTTKINGAIDLDASSIIARSDFNMNQNDITKVLSIGNDTAPISLVAPSGLSLNSTVGTTNQYLGSNASGQPTWKTLPTVLTPPLNDVLEAGNTTTETATFNTVPNPLFPDILKSLDINGTRVYLETTGDPINSIQTTLGDRLTIYNTSESGGDSGFQSGVFCNYMYVMDGLNDITTVQRSNKFEIVESSETTELKKDKLAFSTDYGIQKNGTALQLNTNGTLKLNGLTGTTDNVLKLNSSGNAVWGAAVKTQNLNSVLGEGNTTTNSAIFNGTTTNQTTVEGNSIIITDGTTTNTLNKTGITTRNSEQNSIHYLTFVDNATTGITAIQKTAGIECHPLNNTISATTFIGNVSGNTVNTDTIDTKNVGLLTIGATNTTSISLNGSTISLVAPSGLSLNSNVGTVGQYLGSNAVGQPTWKDLPTLFQSGETGVLSETSGTVTYATPFATKPYVVLSLNTNLTTIFIPIGLYSHTIDVGTGLYTGFTWASASISSSATISWRSSL